MAYVCLKRCPHSKLTLVTVRDSRQSVRSELRQFVGLPLEVVVTLDTTESKASLLAIIQSTMATVAERLFGDLPQLRLAVLAHGDYDTQPYVTQQLDFTKNTNEVRVSSCRKNGDIKYIYK